MQIKKYRIADSLIELRIPFPCREQRRFALFQGEGEADILVEFQVRAEAPENLGMMIYSSDIHVFQNGEQLCIEHYVSVKEKPYAWLIWKMSTPRRLKCIILEEEAELYGNIAHLFQLIRLEQLCMLTGGLILHSSFVQWREKGILFTAPSGTGKSTQAELWHRLLGAEIINGDRVILRRNNGIWKAYGLPYAGSSEIYLNKSANIGAIIVLRQADHNCIEDLKPGKAFQYLYSELILRSWDREYQEILTEELEDLVLHVPVYLLHCRPDRGAVDLVKEKLTGESL